MRTQESRISRKIYTLSDFRGVDYASSPLEVKPYRATDMANLLLKDGVLHKRNGWRQLFKGAFSSTLKTEEPRCIIPFGHRVFVRSILHQDGKKKSIYREISLETGEIGEVIESDGVERNASFVESKGVLYVADGTYFKLFYEEETNKICKVLLDKDNCESATAEEKQPYIPTTTINITSLEASSTIVASYPRVVQETLSLLTPWRRNVLIYQNPTVRLRYRLDGVPYEPSVADMDAENGFCRAHYPKLIMEKGVDRKEFCFSPMKDEEFPEYPYWVCKAADYSGSEKELVLGKYSTLEKLGILTEDAIIEDEDGETTEKTEEEISAGQNREVGFLILPRSFLPWQKKNTWEYEDIVCTVQFMNAYDVESEAETLDKIKLDRLYRTNLPNLSTVHGVEGANDRIFISGKYEKTRNYVYYSENERFDYLPVNQFLVCGDTNAEITAFEKLSDGSLAVFKDVPSLRETAVYYITGRMQSLGIGEEGNEYFMDVFSVSGGTINKNGVSAKSTINYDGDSLFCANDGVYAITLSENLYTSERYAKERSRPISSKLIDSDLRNATAIVYDNRYYLSLADGSKETYVADSRYRYVTEGTERTSFNYEWFRLTNIPAIDFLERDDKLYFLSEEGWICVFWNGYSDVYKEEKESGNFTLLQTENGKSVAFNKDVADIVRSALYAKEIGDEAGEKWEIKNIRSETVNGQIVNVFDVPDYITSDEEGRLGLELYVPVKAHWQSCVSDLGSSFHRKNLWSVSATATPRSKGKVSVGYKTRRAENANEIEGAGIFDFGDMDFALFSFDAGGFINAYRQRTFARGFVYMQLYFASDNDGDAVINELAVEYTPTNKNIGVG